MDRPAGRHPDQAVGLSQSRVVLVAGGGRGIGRAISARLAARGHHVVVAARTGQQVGETVDQICGQGLSAEAQTFDVTDPNSVATVITHIVKAHGRLDIAVNAAGTSYIAPVLLGKTDEWRRVLDTNLLGAFILSRAVLRPMMRQKWGRIIHIGSISSQIGAAYNAIYAASKSGVDGLVRSLALEVAPIGITVNAVAPGYVETGLFEYTQGTRASLKGITLEQQTTQLRDEIPTGRLIQDDEVAAAVEYLSSEDAGAVTGQILNVDGGRTAI